MPIATRESLSEVLTCISDHYEAWLMDLCDGPLPGELPDERMMVDYEVVVLVDGIASVVVSGPLLREMAIEFGFCLEDGTLIPQDTQAPEALEMVWEMLVRGVDVNNW